MNEPKTDVTFRSRIRIRKADADGRIREEALPDELNGEPIRYEVIEGVTQVSRPEDDDTAPQKLTPVLLQKAVINPGANELPIVRHAVLLSL